MEIANLQAFIAVVEDASFSAAAARLHLTQPAVSKRIATLEAELGMTLFDRLGRQVVPTEAGRVLLPRARRALAELDDGRRALANLGDAVSGRLAIATSHHIGLHRLPSLLREFVARYPDVELDLRFTDSELGCDAVARGDVELAIVTLPRQDKTSRSPIVCVPVWDDPLAVVAALDHPLAGQRLTPAQLSSHPAVMPGEVTFTRRLIDGFLGEHRIKPTMTFSTNYLETIKMMVSVGLGWSVLPRTMLDDSVIALDVEEFSVHRTLGAVHHVNHTLSNAARRMLDLLQAV